MEKDYSGTPLEKKLGIVSAKPKACEVAVVGAPEGFRGLLGEAPLATFTVRLTKTTNLAIVFVRSAKDVQATAEMLAAQLPGGASAWMVWPKAKLKPGFSGDDVRNAGLAVGLVDYKICSVSEEWSGMKFARRKAV